MNLYQTLKHYFGYDTLRPGQQDLMEGILNGSDVLGIMPTGAGKSILLSGSGTDAARYHDRDLTAHLLDV